MYNWLRLQQPRVHIPCAKQTSRLSCWFGSRRSHPCNQATNPRSVGAGRRSPDLPLSFSMSGPEFRVVAPNVDPQSLTEYEKKKCILFYTPDTESLARKIAAANDKVTLGEIRWGEFADGFPNVFVKDAEKLRNRHVGFLASFHNPAVIFAQISVIYALPRLFVGSFTLVLPFFPTGTLERVENEGEVATAFTLARILSNIPLPRGGPTSIVIFDIHALQERFYFGDGVLPLFESGIPLLIDRLKQMTPADQDEITIAYPDEGAWKRFHYQFKKEGWPEVICTKVRDGAKRIVRLKEGDAENRHVVIVDDLVQSGSTLIECANLLFAHSAKKVSAYVTHGVFPNKTWEKFKPAVEGQRGGFSYFWLTDSHPITTKAVEGVQPFEILTLAQPIAAALQI